VKRYLPFVLLAIAGGSAMPASAVVNPGDGDEPVCRTGACAPDEVGVETIDCPRTQGRRCLTPTTPLVTTSYNLVSLWCEPGDSSFLCEAFPQDETYPNPTFFTYKWTVTGQATLPVPTGQYNPFKTVGCRGAGAGSVTVTITTRYKIVATKTVNLSCY
jgi:hypothetical protein